MVLIWLFDIVIWKWCWMVVKEDLNFIGIGNLLLGFGLGWFREVCLFFLRVFIWEIWLLIFWDWWWFNFCWYYWLGYISCEEVSYSFDGRNIKYCYWIFGWFFFEYVERLCGIFCDWFRGVSEYLYSRVY